MSFEETITEYDMDANARQIARIMSSDGDELEPDLAVDGLNESIVSRLLGLFGVGKS